MIDVVSKHFFGAYLQRHTSRGNHSPVSAFRDTSQGNHTPVSAFRDTSRGNHSPV